MLDWQAIILYFGLGGVSVAAIVAAGWRLLRFGIEKTIEETIKFKLAERIETTKLEHSIILERAKNLTDACGEFGALYNDIAAKLDEFMPHGGPNYIDALMRDFHPKYMKQFRALRAKFEANDLMSSYSLMLERILSERGMRKYIDSLDKKGRGDVRYIYRKAWLTAYEATKALNRMSIRHEFWRSPEGNYGERADAWAEYDFAQIQAFLVKIAQSRSPSLMEVEAKPFYLTLETKDGHAIFWQSLPTPGAQTNVA